MTDIVERLEALKIIDEVGSDNPLGRDAAALIKELRSEITRLRAASEWRDISTAPRDTKAFLVWVPENQCTFQVSRTDRGLCIFGGDHRDYLDRATHWMPLPAPPQRNEVKK